MARFLWLTVYIILSILKQFFYLFTNDFDSDRDEQSLMKVLLSALVIMHVLSVIIFLPFNGE